MEDLSLDAAAHSMPARAGPSADFARVCVGSVGGSMDPNLPDADACWAMDHDAETPAVAQLRGLEACAKQVGRTW